MFKRFLDDNGGGIAAMTAILFCALVGVAGLGIELGHWFTVKRSMQAAADAAAIEASETYAADIVAGQTSSTNYQTAGQALAAKNGWENGTGNVSVVVQTPPAYGNYASSTYANQAFEALISRPQPPFLAWMVGYAANTTVMAHAVALISTSQRNDGCILALNSASNAITLNGGGTAPGGIFTQNCGVVSDGGVKFNGNNSEVVAPYISTESGTNKTCPSSPQCQVSAVYGPQIVSDPYATTRSFTTPPATPSPCQMDLTTLSPNSTYCGQTVSSGSYTFTQSSYFYGPMQVSGANVTFGSSSGDNVFYFDGGLSISNGSITFEPGIYYIEGGSFSVTGQSTVTGSGVTIILTKSPDVNSAAISSAGAGYSLNDILTVSGGTYTTAAQLQVTGVSAGAITSVSVITPGSYSAFPSNPVSVTGGTGSGATFTLNGGSYYANASVQGNSTTQVTLSAPTASTVVNLPSPPGGTATENTAGLVFDQDPNAGSGAQITVAGNGTTTLTGAVYSPTGTIKIAGNGLSGSACTQIVGQYVQASGNGQMQDNCSGDGTINFGPVVTSVAMTE